MTFVTFVVPTLGRESLKRAIDSLYAQTDDDWTAVIVGDGCNPSHALGIKDWPRSEMVLDERIDIFCPHTLFGTAGETRNWGIDTIQDEFLRPRPEWIAFLDDDDYLSPDYVAHLREHAEDYPWADVVIFRMKHLQLGILPLPNGHLTLGTVGISFAIRSESIGGIRFKPERVSDGFHEDWAFVEELQQSAKKIFISPHIDYFVREATT